MSTYLEARETEIFAKQGDILAACGVDRPLVFDVGANVGQSIRRYRTLLPKCRIHSFEPIPALHEVIRSQWGTDEDVSLHSIALSHDSGRVPFHVTKLPEMSSLLAPDPQLMQLSRDNKYEYDVIEVQCRPIDDVCPELGYEHIDILKIDVQGAELEVLKGAQTLLSAGAIGMIYLEVTMAASYVNQMKLRDLLEFLEPLGYQLWDILPFVYTDAGRVWTANALFVSSGVANTVEAVSRGRNRKQA